MTNNIFYYFFFFLLLSVNHQVDRFAPFIWYLQDALQKIPTVRGGIVYRTLPVASSTLGAVVEKYHKGRIVHWPSFASATQDRHAATAMKSDCAVLFKVRCRSARSVAEFSRFVSQKEVIFPPNW